MEYIQNNIIYFYFKEMFIMTQERVDMFLMTNQKYLPAEKIVYIKEKLLTCDENKFNLISAQV